MFDAEPYVSTPERVTPHIDATSPLGGDALSVQRVPARYVPERGLVRRIRAAQANDDIGALALRHNFDPDTRKMLAAELIKAGAPPITSATVEMAMSRLVTFEPLNVDALRPFLLLSADRMLRAQAFAQVGVAMHSAGRSVKLVSDAADTRSNEALIAAGDVLGCGVTQFDGTPDCVSILRGADLACLNLVEAGFRTPLDKIAVLRLTTLVQATGAEPIVVIRPEDAPLAARLATIGIKRVILAQTSTSAALGPLFKVLREANLALAEVLDMRGAVPKLRPAEATTLAAMLTDTQPIG